MANPAELLAEREATVLRTVLEQYIATGEPVGSRTVAKVSGLNLSSATIRNIMLDLEEAGYLRQPHVSAGRIPTALGFRYYVDHILRFPELAAGTQRQIQQAFQPAATEPQELFRQASRALSTLTGHPALVLTPRPQALCLKHIQFISLGGDMVLTLLVTQDQRVQTRFVRSEVSYTQEQLDRFSRYLNDICFNLTLREARLRILSQMQEEKNLFDRMVSQALSLSRQALQGSDEDEGLYIEGTSHILDYPEFAEDVEKIRAIFKTFEEKHHLITLLDQTMASQGVQIIISPDEHFPEMELSLVASAYSSDQAPLGSLGVIGPMRMDYARVVPIVSYTASVVSDRLRRKPD
ncbi:MAG: heat-inducible transcription repressor HrcA [Deltaproteobacteria bacterium]|nr:heat-inducible transcription repressor HrcA [Deltaproteobacteria bacterium]